MTPRLKEKLTVVPAARRFIEKGELDKALAEYRRAVGNTPDDPRIWHRIGDVQLKKGALREALEAYRRSAAAYAAAGFYAKAVALYKQMLTHDPTNLEVHLRLAELLRLFGMAADARRQLEVAVSMCRGSDRSFVENQLVQLTGRELAATARQLRSDGRMDEFVEAGERAIELGLADPELVRMIAHAQLERGRPELAIARLRAQFDATPEDPGVLDLLATAFEQQGRVDRALQVLRALACVLHRDGLVTRRDAVYRRILAHVPDDADARRALGIPPLVVEEEIVIGADR